MSADDFDEADELIERYVSNLPPDEAEWFRNRCKWWLWKDGELIMVDDVITWAQGMEEIDRVVAQDEVVGPDGNTYQVSTVFLGLDHSFMPGPPLLWETMIFKRHSKRAEWVQLFGRFWITNRESTGYQFRYSTIEQAEAGHRGAICDVLAGNYDDPLPEP